jgi:transcriptional regulator with XRE-family HTH domain
LAATAVPRTEAVAHPAAPTALTAGSECGGRSRRLPHGLTQQAVADLADMSLTYISNMEHGLKVPSLTTIVCLAVALDCKVTDLVRGFDKTDLRLLLPK